MLKASKDRVAEGTVGIMKMMVDDGKHEFYDAAALLKLAEKRKTTRVKAETTRLRECRDDEV